MNETSYLFGSTNPPLTDRMSRREKYKGEEEGHPPHLEIFLFSTSSFVK